MMTDLSPKIPKKYCCQNCDYTSSSKKDYKKHLLTLKHKLVTTNDTNVLLSQKKYECQCGKKYAHRQGVYSHKKHCTFINQPAVHESELPVENNTLDLVATPEMILNIIQQNQEFKNLLVEQSKYLVEISKKENATNYITNNSNNKTFNLQVFLNETCKNAMNITDFVDSIQLQLSDFERIGQEGYVNGISNIIIKNLKALDTTMLPVHCSDLKRESIYIKENNEWHKDTNNNQALKKAIKAIAHKNTKMIPKYREEYPDTQIGTSKASDNYNRYIIEAMGGRGDNTDEKLEKIVSRIAKEIVICKQG